MSDQQADAPRRSPEVRELGKREMQQVLGGGTLVGNPGTAKLVALGRNAALILERLLIA